MSEWVLGKFRKVYIRCFNGLSQQTSEDFMDYSLCKFSHCKETKTVGEEWEDIGQLDIGQNSGYVCSPMDSSLETSDMCTSVVNGRLVLQNHHEQPTSELSPTQTTTSPEHKKASRRSRSFT